MEAWEGDDALHLVECEHPKRAVPQGSQSGDMEVGGDGIDVGKSCGLRSRYAKVPLAGSEPEKMSVTKAARTHATTNSRATRVRPLSASAAITTNIWGISTW